MGGGGSTTTVQSASPWAGQQPFLSSLYNTAADLTGFGPNGPTGNNWPQYYQGQQVAPINDQQAAPLWQQFSTALNGGTGPMQAGANYEQNTLNGAYLNANPGSAQANELFGMGLNNPANSAAAVLGNTGATQANPGSADLSAMARGDLVGANAPGFQNVVNTTLANVMPQIESTFAGSGRMDSGAAARAAAQGATDAIGGLAYQNYNTQLQNQLAAAGQLSSNFNTGIANQLGALGLQSNNFNSGLANDLGAAGLLSNNYNNAANNQRMAALMAPSYDAQTMQDLNTAQNLGNTEQNNTQQNINAAMQKWNYNQMLPFNMAQMYQGLISGNPGSTQSTWNAMGGGAANALSGASGTVGLLNGINTLTSSGGGGSGIVSQALQYIPTIASTIASMF